MPKTIAQLAEFLSSQGLPCTIEGDGSRTIQAVATLEDAGPADVSFLANARYEKLLGATRAGAVIVSDKQPALNGLTLMRVREPYEAMMRLVVYLHGYRKHRFEGISAQATIDPSATIGEAARIAQGVTVA